MPPLLPASMTIPPYYLIKELKFQRKDIYPFYYCQPNCKSNANQMQIKIQSFKLLGKVVCSILVGMSNSKSHLYSFLIVLQSIIFALIDVFGKIAFTYVDVVPFLVFRLGIATLVLLLLYGKTTIKEFRTVNPKYYLVPAICLASSIIISSVAIRITAATTYSFIRNLTALIVPMLMCIFFKRKYTLFDLILQTVLLTGLYLLCVKGSLSKFGLGEILALGAAFLISINLVWGADSVKHVSSMTLTTAQMGVGFIFVVIYGFASGNLQTASYQNFLIPKVILIVLFNSLVGTVIGYMIQNIALKHISSKVVGIVQSVYPVATFTAAHFLIGENLNTMGLIGAGLILACVVVQSTRD